jgi:hypothetical protein
MKNEMQKFLDKLDQLNFVSIDGNTLHTSEGFEISYNLKMMMSRPSDYPIQLLLRVCSDGVYITSWGCTSNEDNLTATKWWAKKSNDIHNKMFEATCEKEASIKRMFNQLTK